MLSSNTTTLKGRRSVPTTLSTMEDCHLIADMHLIWWLTIIFPMKMVVFRQTLNVELHLKPAAIFSALLSLLKLSLSFWGSQRSRISPLQSCMFKIRCGSKMMPGKSQDTSSWLLKVAVGQNQEIQEEQRLVHEGSAIDSIHYRHSTD